MPLISDIASILGFTNPNPDSTISSDYPNPLHAYPSYTYSLSLHLLSSKQWNDVMQSGQYIATNVLIASGGRYDNTSFVRNKNFLEDFYLDNLKFNTIIGPTDTNSGTNAIDVEFSIFEPYGVTLLDRIIDANNELDPPEPNYIQSIYLMQVDFFGSNDAGEIVHPIPNQTKYIPIKILEMEIDVSHKGSEYKLKAVPVPHEAFTQTSQQTPANFEITAKTVKEFFVSTVASSSNSQSNQRSDTVNPDEVYSKGGVYKNKSYASAINAWNYTLKNQNEIGQSDLIDFVFDDEIGVAKLVEGGKLPPRSTPYSDLENRQILAKGDVSNSSVDLRFDARTYPIQTGTTIESVLTYVIKNSEYITKQIVNPDEYNGDLAAYIAAKKNIESEPFKWFKIVPKMTYLDYDTIRKRRARKIIYYIKKYEIRNLKVDFGPGGLAQTPMKSYNYIYTGANDDIIDLDIKFNTAYYTTKTASSGKLMEGSGAANPLESFLSVLFPPDSRASALQPIQYEPIVGDQRTQATGGAISGRAVLAGDAVRSILNDSAGDMINVKLKILGDPMYIKQDDVFYPPELNESTGGLTDNGSLKTDNGEVYVQVGFKAPTDRNEAGVAMYYNPKYAISLFSGMYRVLTVENEFSGGKFTQNLELIRQPKQPTLDYKNGTIKDSSATQRGTAQNPLAGLDISPASISVQGYNAITGLGIGVAQTASTLTTSLQGGLDALQTSLAPGTNLIPSDLSVTGSAVNPSTGSSLTNPIVTINELNAAQYTPVATVTVQSDLASILSSSPTVPISNQNAPIK